MEKTILEEMGSPSYLSEDPLSLPMRRDIIFKLPDLSSIKSGGRYALEKTQVGPFSWYANFQPVCALPSPF